MKKHLQLLALIAAICLPLWGRAQALSDYAFQTGTDASKWITLSSPTSVWTGYQDDVASSVFNIGFSFPFGEDSYSQFSVSSNGMFCLGTAATSTTTAGQFTSSYYNQYLPKICGIARDLGTGTDGGVRYQLTGTAPNRIFVCEFAMGYTFGSSYAADVKWQVQLHENGTVCIVYGPTTPSTIPSSFQTGLAATSDDIVILNPSTHQPIYCTTYHSTTYSTWHGANRYYEFSRPSMSCPKPFNAMVTNLTPESFDVSWTDTTDATTWLVRLDSAGVEGLVNEVYDTTLSFSGLTQNTPYTINIASLCSNGDTSSWRIVSQRTPCSYYSIPYTEDFETYGTGTTAFPNCWNRIGSTTERPYIQASTSYGHNNTYGLYFYAASGGYCYAVMPATNHSIDSLQVSFWARQYSTSYDCSFAVGVMTNPNDISTFVAIDTVHPSSTTYELFDVPLNRYTGTGQYIAFSSIVNSGSNNYLLLDDVTVDYIPACPHVVGLRSTQVLADEATLVWREVGGSTSWTVEYGPAGFTPGEGTVEVAYDSTITLYNLTPNTVYDVYVTVECSDGPGGVMQYSFRTACSYYSIPYTENFDTYGTGTTAFPNCWTRVGTTAERPYIQASTSYGHNNTYGLYFYAASGGYCYAVMPATNHSIDSLLVTFWARQYSTSYNCSFAVGVMTNPNDVSTFVAVDTVHPSSTTYESFEVSFSNYTGTGSYIAFSSIMNTTSGNYLLLDDVTVDFIPDCPRVENITVSNITSNSVDLNWMEMGDGTSWTLTVASTDTNFTEYVSSLPYTLAGLNPNTQYTVTVTVDCGSGVGGSNAATFRTACGAMTTLPYVYGFEDAAAGSSATGSPFVNCWNLLNNGTSYGGYPYVSNSTTYNHTPGGSKGLYWYNTTTTGSYGDYQCVVLPGIDTDAYPINTLQLKFWAKASSTSYSPVFQVGVMTDPYDINTFHQVGTVNVGSSTNWAEYITSFGNYTGYGQYLAVKAVRPSSSWYAYVDDFTIDLIPACPDVINMDVASVGTTGAYITWGYRSGTPGTPASYDVEVSENTDGATPTTYTSTEPAYLISGLSTSTEYKVRVRANCDAEGYGAWDSIIVNTTGLPCEEFDSASASVLTIGSGTSSSYYVPVGNYYNYSYTQELILASEMNGAAELTGIDFQYSYSSPSSKSNCTIYLCNTSVASLSSSFVPYNSGSFVPVYMGNLNCTTGWNHFEFNQPFSYDGTSNLLLVVLDNSGSYSGSSYTFATHSATGKGRYIQNDGSAYSISSVSGGTAYDYRVNMKLHGLGCAVEGSCGTPMLVVTNVDTDFVDLAWTPGSTESSWNLTYRRQGTTSWSTLESGTSNTSYTVTGLTPATSYEFRLSHECDGHTYAATVTATTPCTPHTVPFSEDFEGFSTTVADPLPMCWEKHTNYTSNYPYASTSYYHSGSKSMYMYSTSSTYTYMVLPIFEPAVDSLQVSFWLYKTNTSYNHDITVGVMTDPEDVTTFTEVATVHPVNLSTWEQFDIPLNSYTGTGRYIAILSPNGVYSYPYLDDLSVNYIPTCPRPTVASTRNVSGNEATIYWPADGVDEHLVEYGPAGFTEGFGYVLSSYDDSLRLTGLNPATRYVAYVKSVCSSDDTSYGTMTSFTTACGMLASLPYTYDFEYDATGSSSTGSAFVNCWYRLNNGTSYGGYPYVSSSSTYNHTPGGTKGLYWYNSITTGTYGDYQCVVFPAIDTDVYAMNTLQLSFWAKASSTSYYPTFQVGVMTDPTDINTFQQVATVNVSGTDFRQYDGSLADFTGYGSYIALRANRPSSSWYAYVDDIEIGLIPTCFRPTAASAAVTTTDATLSWTPDSRSSDASEYEIEYGPTGFMRGVGMGTVVNAYTTTETLTSLTANTAYTAYIRAICGPDDTSAAFAYNFRTDCDAIPHEDLPYVEDFEACVSGTTGTIDPCWRKGYYGVSDSYPYVSTSYHASGSKSLYFYGYSTSYYSYAVMPMFEDSLTNLMVSFKLLKTTDSYGSINVGIMTDPADISTFHSITTVSPVVTSAWESFSVPLTNYRGPAGHIAFLQNSTYYTYLDDVVVDVLPDCAPVRDLTVSEVMGTSALATWSVQPGVSNSNPAEYEIVITDEYGTPVANATDTNMYYLIGGLQPQTEYQVKVRVMCENSEYGPWDSVSFTTGCLAGGDIAILGNGTSTTTYYQPLNNFYNYSYTQELVLASEMNGPTTINGISFEYAYASPMTSKTNCSVYVGHTNMATLSTTSLVDPATMTLVYTGPLNCTTNGWNTFTFTTPFAYDGTSNLVVAVDDNSGSYNSSSYVFRAYNTSNTRAILYYSDSENPNPSTLSSLLGYSGSKSSYSYRVGMKFVTPCDENATCVAPHAHVDYVADTFAGFSWVPGLNETSWDIDYRAVGDTDWIYETNTAANNYELSYLAANQSYEVRITANCSDSLASTVFTITTTCRPQEVPFTESFETFPTNGTDPFPSCWDKHTNYSTNYPYALTSYAHSGGKSMYMYSSSSTYSYMVLPVFAPAIDSLQVSFWLYSTTSSYSNEIKVGVMTDPTDVNTFVEVGSATPSTLSTWEPFEIPLNNYTGNGQFIALMSPNGVSCYPYLDDLTVERISPCPRIRNVYADNIGLNAATIKWDATAADDYEVQYGPAGFAFGTGTTQTTGGVDSLDITGLAPSTCYQVYVRGICSPDTGNWSFAYSFYTECAMIDSLPFFENFNNIGTSTSVHAPHCWTGASTYSSTYPYPSASYNYSGSGASMYMYHYNNGTYYTMLQMPPVDTTELPMNTLQVEFALLRNTSSYFSGIIVGVCSGSGMVNFQPIDTVNVNSISTWEYFEVPFNNFNGTGNYITFVAYSGSDSYCYPYFDDVTLTHIPSCIRPDDVFATTLTTTDATIMWTLRDSTQTDFEVRYGRQGCNVDTCTSIFVSGVDTVLLTGLDSGVYYDVYVRSICGANDTSLWRSNTFRTLVSSPVSTFPYICDFTGAEGQNWTLESNGQTNKWYLGNTVYCGTADSMAIYISDNNGTTHSYNTSSISHSWAYRTFNMPVGQYAYSFNWMAQGESNYYDFIRVFLVPAGETLLGGSVPGGSTYDFGNALAPAGWIDLSQVTSAPYTLNGFSSWQNISGTFDVTTAGTYNLAFVWSNDGSGGSNPPAAIDNVQIFRNSCPSPDDFHVTGNTSTSVTVDWTSMPDVTGYELCANTTGTPTPDTSVTSGPVTFTGLTPGQTYNFYIRAICDYGSDSSMWVGPITAVLGTWNMRANQYDTVRMCGGVIYSSGGASGTYTDYETTVVYLLPDAPNNLVSVQGSWLGESCCDYYYIYDGIGESGTVLSTGYGSSLTIPTCISTNGPLTIKYTSDVSSHYRGLELFVSCVSTSCRIFNVRLNSAVPQSDSQLAITWDTNGANEYQVQYGNAGFALGTGITRTVYTNNITLTGLTALTNYDVYVRSICGAGDTGSWSSATFQTAMCASSTEAYSYSSTMSATTSTYAPIGYSTYNYSYTQTIVDSAQLADLDGDITAFAFNPSSTSTGNYYTHCDLYLANVPESTLTGFIHPDTNHVFVKVINDADFCYTTTGWQLHGFDTTFTWDGHSNLLVSVNRRHGSWSGGATFNAHTTSGTKSWYVYNDGSAYSPTTVSGGSSLSVVGDMKFIACAEAGCRQPDITGITHNYETATVAWTGSGSNYEVAIKESAATTWGASIPVTGTSYTFTGLQPTTYYDVRVRQDCTADSLDYSDWTIDGFLTDSLPCLAPQNLTTTDVTNATATFSWTARGYETAWDIHVWFTGGLDTTYTVTTNPATVSGFTAGVTYNAAIRPLCGSAHNIEGEYGDTITFTTQVCPNVTGLSFSNVTANSVTLSWTADPMAESWVIEYGYSGFSQGRGTTATSANNSYVINGLEEDTPYDFYVRAVCGTDWTSEGWASTSATTAEGGVTCDAPTNVTAVVAGNAATINWNAGEGNISFEVEYGIHGFSHGAGTTATATTAPATIANLAYETNYDVYVRAVCAQNTYSAWSSLATFTTEAEPSTDCDPVQNLAATQITDNSVIVTWTPGEHGSIWEVVLTDAAGNTLDQATTEETSHQFSNLTESTDYIVKVRTKCDDDQYSNYVSVSFRTTGEEGIDDILNASCTIYPNPTSSATTISVSGVNGQVRISVVDMNGRVVTSETMECAADCAKTMDVDALAQGAYFVRITGENINMVKKLIVR